MESLIYPSCAPVTSLSLVSVSTTSADRCQVNSRNLSHLDDIYKNSIFSHSFSATQSRQNQDGTETRQNSKSSVDSDISTASTTYSKSRSNSNLVTLSPSLKTAYLIKRGSFKKQRSFCNSVEDTIFDSSGFSYFSHRSSITSVSSVEGNGPHPLMVPESVIDDDESNKDRFFTKTSEESDNIDYASYTPQKEILKPPDEQTPSSLKKTTEGLLPFLKKLHGAIQRSSNSFYELKLAQLNLRSTEEVPLETFAQKFEALPTAHENVDLNPNLVDSENFLPLQLCGKTRRIREHRVNPYYLLQYALDTSVREKKLLNCIPNEELDIFDNLLLERYSELSESITFPLNEQIFDEMFYLKLQSQLQFFNNYENVNDEHIYHLKLASIARFKLCATITLPPRLDDVPSISSLIDDIYPTASLDTCHVPWLNIMDLKSGKAINRLTRSAGLLKGSNIQYVSKKCSSKRWVCVNNDQVDKQFM